MYYILYIIDIKRNRVIDDIMWYDNNNYRICNVTKI